MLFLRFRVMGFRLGVRDNSIKSKKSNAMRQTLSRGNSRRIYLNYLILLGHFLDRIYIYIYMNASGHIRTDVCLRLIL